MKINYLTDFVDDHILRFVQNRMQRDFIGLLQSTFIFICYITDSFMGSRRSYKTDIPTGKQI